MNIPKTSDPWRKVEYDGVQYLVRLSAKKWWIVRLPDREVFMFDEVPEWLSGAVQI
jgi:hypothetical protein